MRFSEIAPPETVAGASRCVLSGARSLLLESQRGLVSYENARIRVLTREGVLTVLGKDMTIAHFGRSDMLICGQITALYFGDAP